VIPDKYPGRGVGQLEIIPVNVQSVPRPIPSVVHPVPHQPHPQPISQGGEVLIPIVIVEDSPATRYPPRYNRPNYSHQHHRQPYGGKRKQQPIEVIVIEEAAPNQGDTS